MCGIIGYVGGREAGPLLLEGLRRLEYRGYDSAGIAVIDGQGTPTVVKSLGKLESLANCLEDRFPPGSIGIGHTRWATHGKPERHERSSPLRLQRRRRRHPQRHRRELPSPQANAARAGAPSPLRDRHGGHPTPHRDPPGGRDVAGGGGAPDGQAARGSARPARHRQVSAGHRGGGPRRQRRRRRRRLRRRRDVSLQRPAGPAAAHPTDGLLDGRRCGGGNARRRHLLAGERRRQGAHPPDDALRPDGSREGRLQALHAQGDHGAAGSDPRHDPGAHPVRAAGPPPRRHAAGRRAAKTCSGWSWWRWAPASTPPWSGDTTSSR